MAALSITWYGHATFVLTTPGGKRVVFDPWLNGNPKAPAGAKIDKADVICVSHGHSDHSGDVVTVARTTNVCFSDTLQVTGVVVPRNEILVRPDREGLQISQVLVEPGDTVVSGQVLARLTPPEGQQGANGQRDRARAHQRHAKRLPTRLPL